MVDTYRARLGGNSVVLRPQRRKVSVATTVAGVLETAGNAAAQIVKSDQQTEEVVASSEHRIALEEKRREQSRALAAASGEWAESSARMQRRLIEARTETTPGAPGHEERALEIIDEEVSQYLGLVPDDPEVRERIEPMVRGFAARAANGEYAYELQSRAEFQGQSVEKLMETKRNELRSSPDADLFVNGYAEVATIVNGMDIDGNAKARILDDYADKSAQDLLGGLSDAGQYVAARELINSGKFDAILGPDAKRLLLRQTDTMEAEAARAAERLESEQRDAAREQLDLLQVRAKNDDPPTAAEWNAALAAGRATGVPADEIAEYEFAGSDAIVAGNARTLATPQLESEIEALEERSRAGALDGRSTRRLETLRDVLKDRDEDNGTKLGPLLKSGIEGRTAGVNALADMPVSERYRVAGEAGDPQAAVIATLPGRGRALAVQGGALRKDRKNDFLPPISARVKNQEAEGQRIFKEYLGDELVRAAGSSYGEIYETALDVMAATGGKWDKANFERAVQIVYGATKRRDGTLQGGIGTVRGRRVELPPRWDSRQFDSAYSRQTFAEARYGNGAKVDPADVRKRFRLQHYQTNGDGSVEYVLLGPDERPLRTESQQPYRLRVGVKP